MSSEAGSLLICRSIKFKVNKLICQKHDTSEKKSRTQMNKSR